MSKLFSGSVCDKKHTGTLRSARSTSLAHQTPRTLTFWGCHILTPWQALGCPWAGLKLGSWHLGILSEFPGWSHHLKLVRGGARGGGGGPGSLPSAHHLCGSHATRASLAHRLPGKSSSKTISQDLHAGVSAHTVVVHAPTTLAGLQARECAGPVSLVAWLKLGGKFRVGPMHGVLWCVGGGLYPTPRGCKQPCTTQYALGYGPWMLRMPVGPARGHASSAYKGYKAW